MRFLLVLSLVSSSLAAAQAPEESPLLGRWEMVRVDDVHPRDIPPYGFANLLVEFKPDGTVESWLPGRKEEAEPEPYSLEGSKLTAWLGLSNDLESPRPIKFHGTEWFEITIPEGSTSIFKRSEDPTVDIRCIYFTTVGGGLDSSEISESKERLFRFRPGKIPSGLVGTWKSEISDESEGDYEITLQIAEGSATTTVRSLEFPDIPPNVLKGPIQVSDGYLQTPAIFCGALSSFTLTEATLVVQPDSSDSLALARAVE